MTDRNRLDKISEQDRKKYESLAANLARMIEGGTFRPGERIPSVRQMSRQHRVSISTVLQAYYLLEDRGLIEARPQSGFYVRPHLPASMPEPDISSPEPDPTQVSVHELVMMVLQDTRNPRLVQLGAAIPHPDLLATDKLYRIVARIARRGGQQMGQYDMPPGCEPLRVQIARRAAASGCNLTPDDIVTTSGCQEAINLCLRATCRPGDTVAIESPMYYGILQVMESLDLRALEIPTHPRYGISLDALQFAIKQRPVRACIVLSNSNNPLGSSIPDENKRELVRLLSREEIPLIENNALGELTFSQERPTLAKSYDQKGLVLLCSSYSKDLCPGMRVGWVAPGRYKQKIEWLRFTSSFSTATLPQLAIAQFLAGGSYDHHLRRIRREYAQNVGRMSLAITRCFPEGTRVTRPSGGFVLWIQLPDKVDSLTLYKLALKAGITITPGYIFSATEQYRNFIRLSAAYWSERAERAVEKLGELAARLA
ncbi:MAG: PLP-dependent aminotransferase family protein [Chloroflexota bacterium]